MQVLFLVIFNKVNRNKIYFNNVNGNSKIAISQIFSLIHNIKCNNILHEII